MNKKEKIEQEIQKTLDLFDSAEKLPRNPYFYTRLQARLDERRRKRSIYSAILKPALLTVLVVVNLGTAFWYMSGGEQQYQTDSREELIDILAGDLNLDNQESDLFIIE